MSSEQSAIMPTRHVVDELSSPCDLEVSKRFALVHVTPFGEKDHERESLLLESSAPP
jgi:hypothetical protein